MTGREPARIRSVERDRESTPSKLSLVNLHPPAGDVPPSGAEATSAATPKRFKVVDVLSGSVLAEDASVKDAVAAVGTLRKSIDALVYVREDGGRWRMLSLGDTKALWELRERAAG